MADHSVTRWLAAFGNVGVIAGLVFPGIEIHQNTDIARVTAYRENVQDIAAWRTLLVTDSAADPAAGPAPDSAAGPAAGPPS